MSEREIQIILDDFRELRAEFVALRGKVDRLFWASVLAALAVGGASLSERISLWVMG